MRKYLFTLLFAILCIANTISAQTAQTKKQDLPLTAGNILQDGTVYMATTGEITGNESFPNALVVAENATVTLYIPAGVTLTVTGANASATSNVGAGAGILVPSTSTLYITGEGTLIATGGNGGNGGPGGPGGDAEVQTKGGSTAYSGNGGYGGYGGGGAAAAIGGNGGNGGAQTAGSLSTSARKQTDGINGTPAVLNSTELNGKNGEAGATMGQVYILGKVTVVTNSGQPGANVGLAGTHGVCKKGESGNKTITAGGGGAGAGGGAGFAASFGIGGGAAGAGGGAAGASGAVDNYGQKGLTLTDPNHTGAGGSATAGGVGAINGSIITTGDVVRDNGSFKINNTEAFSRFGGYGGEVGGAAGAAGGNGTTYIKAGDAVDISAATIGNKQIISDIPLTLNVNVKLNHQNDQPAGNVVARIGEIFPNVAIPTKPGYEFMGYYTKPNGDGLKIYDAKGESTAHCNFVEEDNAVLYAHWILMTYTIKWTYTYYDASVGKDKNIPESDRCTSAKVIIRLNDGTTHEMTMNAGTVTGSGTSADPYTTTTKVTLREEVSDEVFNKIVAVQEVKPVDPASASSERVKLSLDYVTESSAHLFYDPTRYTVKWSVNVSVPAGEKKPEYVLVNVKRNGEAISNAADDEPNAQVNNVKIRMNTTGTYDGMAVLKYQAGAEASTKYNYTVEVVGIRDDSGHEIALNPTTVSSGDKGTMSCAKTDAGANIPQIEMTVNLAVVKLNDNGGTLTDTTPETVWAATGSSVDVSPYSAVRANLSFKGWSETQVAIKDAKTASVISSVTASGSKTLYAVWEDTTPPVITFGNYVANNGTDKNTYNWIVPVTITDAVSDDNTMYYAVYDTNPGDIPADDTRWKSATQKGNLKKSETANIKFQTNSIVYVHVKAVDESGNASVKSMSIKVDTEKPVITFDPNFEVLCIESSEVLLTDNVGVTGHTITRNGTDVTSSIALTNGVYTLTAPTDVEKYVYVITATDAAGNTAERTVTIWKEHKFLTSTYEPAKEPSGLSEGYFKYYKCEHCSKIILLSGEEIDITNEEGRKKWIIPAGSTLVGDHNKDARGEEKSAVDFEQIDILAYDATINAAITKAQSTDNSDIVRLTTNTPLDANNVNNITSSSKSLYLDLNGWGIAKKNLANWGTEINGTGNVTILLRDNGALPYTNKSSVTNASPIKYARNVSTIQKDKWQALYLPFEVPTGEGYTLGEINGANFEGSMGAIEVGPVNGGEKGPNIPCFIKSNNADTPTTPGTIITVAAGSGSGLLAADASGSMSYGDNIVIKGSLTNTEHVATAERSFWVVTNGGKLGWAAAGAHQRPYRWVIYDNSVSSGAKPAYEFIISDGEEDVTGIKDIQESKRNSRGVYTLNGVKMPDGCKLPAGVYIVDGKKMVIK